MRAKDRHGLRDAGPRVVIEEGLSGPEVRCCAWATAHRVHVAVECAGPQPIGDGDTGPNTGGMGCLLARAGRDARPGRMSPRELVMPTVDALRRRDIDHRGRALRRADAHAPGPKVLEFNARFGDPEAQVVLPRLSSTSPTRQVRRRLTAQVDRGLPDASVTVVFATPGYPDYRTGDVIEGLDAARAVVGASVYCASVATDEQRRLVTAGGRVLAVTGRGRTVADARTVAYEAVAKLTWPGLQHRLDIAAHPTI